MIRDYLERVCWYSGASIGQGKIPPWEEAGIKLGFSGLLEDPEAALHYPKQVHGTKIVEAGARTKNSALQPAGMTRIEADGIYTCEPATAVAVQTADCLPVLFSHSRSVMAVHAGWRGMVAGILIQATDILQTLESRPEEVTVFLGPAIGMAAFQVGPELVDDFRDYFSDLNPGALAWVLMKGQADRWHIDLATAACLSLQALGFSADRIYCYRACTKTDSSNWHSYRRDGQKAGRNWSWLSLNNSPGISK